MNRRGLEVGAFSWARFHYDADAVVYWHRCESEGLRCPQEVFAQLFHEEANNEDFAVIVRSIDYYSAFGPLRCAVRAGRKPRVTFHGHPSTACVRPFQAAAGYTPGVQREAALLVGAKRLTPRVPFGAVPIRRSPALRAVVGSRFLGALGNAQLGR